MHKIFLFILLYFLSGLAWAQEATKPVGSFNQDSVKLGELIQYRLFYQHPATQEVIFPDSNYTFATFEFVEKNFYPTTTNAGISTDSVIYTLRTFQTDTVQALALPVYILQGSDTIQVASDTSRVILKQLVHEVQEPLRFKTQTGLASVEKRFNWPYLFLWIVASFVFLSLIWFIFGKAIIIKYKLYRLRKDHLYFASRYNSHLDRFMKTGSAQSMEKAVSLWKNYLTRLERSAINSFTTKEIVEYYHHDEEVSLALRLCDRAIYGNLLTEADEETKQALSLLRRFAKRRYKTQRQITGNAKTKR